MKYPIRCACCNQAIINESHEICSICGWEDDKAQNRDELFVGGANKLSLMEQRALFLKEKFVKHKRIDFLEKTGIVRAFYTLNEKNVWKYEMEGAKEDFDDLAKTFCLSENDMVMVNQTHSSNIRIMDKNNGGELINRPMIQENVDGMITNEKGLLLCTVEADCVPVYIVDPVKEVIGMVHSGWKGTANIISVKAIQLMKEKYDSNFDDIMVAIGPCMCGNCYEVGSELLDEFSIHYDKCELDSFFVKRGNGKYLLDMKKAIILSLIKNGIKAENIHDTRVCTYETDNLCSWRRDKSKLARMLTAIMLK